MITAKSSVNQSPKKAKRGVKNNAAQNHRRCSRRNSLGFVIGRLLSKSGIGQQSHSYERTNDAENKQRSESFLGTEPSKRRRNAPNHANKAKYGFRAHAHDA